MYTLRWLENVVSLWALSVNLVVRVTLQVSMKKDCKTVIHRFEHMNGMCAQCKGSSLHSLVSILFIPSLHPLLFWEPFTS